LIDFVFQLPETGLKAFKLQISERLQKVSDHFHGDDFDLDDVGEDASSNQQELIKITCSICNISDIPSHAFRKVHPDSNVCEAHFSSRLALSDGDLLFEISWHGRLTCSRMG
jgi:hypothetical protein